MLKLMKYEFRKTWISLLCFLGAMIFLEIGFFYGLHRSDYDIVGVCLALLTVSVFSVYAYILCFGVSSYSNELSNKTGYMIFMTPVTPMGIIVSKLLYTIVSAIVVTLLFTCVTYYDYAKFINTVDTTGELLKSFRFAFFTFNNVTNTDFGFDRFLLILGSESGTVLLNIILVMCTAYLAITIRATIMQTNKPFIRFAFSFIIFMILNYITTRAGSALFGSIIPETVEQMVRLLVLRGVLNFGFIVLFASTTAWLLDTKINL